MKNNENQTKNNQTRQVHRAVVDEMDTANLLLMTKNFKMRKLKIKDKRKS